MPEQKTPECIAIADPQQLLQQSLQPVIIIDVRNPDEYAAQHIPGAINIPLNELEIRSNELSKQSIIVTTCGKGDRRSADAALRLHQLGFEKANYLCGGTNGWFESGIDG